MRNLGEQTPLHNRDMHISLVGDQSAKENVKSAIQSANSVDKLPTAVTGLDEKEADSSATKLLRDGQILILRGEKVYTVTGQEAK